MPSSNMSEKLREFDGEKRLENGFLFAIAERFFSEVNLGGHNWGFECFYYGRFIPEEKFALARDQYASYDLETEKPLIYYDNSFNGNWSSIESSGFVISNKYFYYKLVTSFTDNKYKIGKIPIAEITGFKIRAGFTGYLTLDGHKKRFKLSKFTFLDRREARILEEVVRKIITELKKPR